MGGLLSVAFVLLFGAQQYQVEIHQPGVHGLHGCSLFRRPPAVQERPFLFLRGEQELEAVAQVKVKDLGTVQCVHHYITASCLVQRLDEPRLDGVQQFVAYVQSLIVLADGKLPYQRFSLGMLRLSLLRRLFGSRSARMLELATVKAPTIHRFSCSTKQ